MANLRLIARLDIKMEHLIKGIHLEGWRKVGAPEAFARRYYEAGVDELLFMDVVASLYGRNNLAHVVERVASEVFVPLTVGGGIRSTADVKALLDAGADKVAVNTAATREPDILRAISGTYGSQATVLSIEASRLPDGRGWEAMTDNGRNRTGLDVVAWAETAAGLGAGEILVTSVDRDGTKRGMDVELVRAVAAAVEVPVIAGGGVGSVSHVVEAARDGGAGAVAMARVLHYGDLDLAGIRRGLADAGIAVREPETA